MRTIIEIEGVEEFPDKSGGLHYRTYAILDDGTEARGYGPDFEVGDEVEVFYVDEWDTIQMKKPNLDLF